MNNVETQLGTVYPEDAKRTIRLQPYYETVVGGARSQLLYLLAAVVVVLLIACGNIASLMLARATARQGELSTRVALGASRTRLVQQLVTESTLLAFAGGASGFLLATLLLRALQQSAATALPRMTELGLSPASFIFTVLLSLVAGTFVGAASAWRATALAVHPALSIGGRGSHARTGTRIREAVVTLQLVASLVLLASASVLLESFWRLAHVNPGFDDAGVATGTIFMPAERYSFASAADWWATLLPQVAAIPHVTSVSAASQIPLSPGGNASYVPAGTTPGPGVHRPTALINVVADRYFETMRIPISAGNTFSKEGAAGQIGEVVISQSIGRKLSLLGAVIGQRMTFPDFGGFTGEVVGVVGDVRADLGREAPDIIYFPMKRMSGWARNMHMLVRTDGDPLEVVPQIRRMVAERDPLLAVGRVRTMSDIIGRSVARQRLDATILGGFGAVALLLAALGLYGLLAYAVATRTHEFRIRLALGAQRGQLFRLVVWNGMRLVAIGLGAGLLLVPVVVRTLQSVFEGTAINAAAVSASAVALGLIGLCACVVPAIRATRVGPVLARPD